MGGKEQVYHIQHLATIGMIPLGHTEVLAEGHNVSNHGKIQCISRFGGGTFQF